MGTQIKVTETFSLSTGKVLRDDAILPAQGALVLFDAGHTKGGLGVASNTMPTNGQVFPNVAYDQALAMIGSGDATTLGGKFTTAGTYAADIGKERTPKGGLHIAPKQNGAVANGTYAALEMGVNLLTRIRDNPNNDYYVSLWSNVTRAAGAAGAVPLPYAAIYSSSGSATSNQLLLMTTGGLIPGFPGAAYLGSRNTVANGNSTGVQLKNAGVQTYTGAVGTGNGINANAIIFGAGSAWGSFVGGTANMPSWIFYRFYVEDLTVSGRSYATVDALDYALWQEAFAAGGRFNGDTFTAPATLAGG